MSLSFSPALFEHFVLLLKTRINLFSNTIKVLFFYLLTFSAYIGMVV